MIILERYAQKIVDEMKKIINYDLNFMNKGGVIIACTDPSRKGQYHEGAELAIKNKENSIIKYDNQYIGSKAGIVMPVSFKNDFIGAIGITGEEEVRKYGIIIKEMTEILIKEAYLKDLDVRKTASDRALIEDIIFSDKYLKNNEIVDRVKLYEANVKGPKAVIISKELYDDLFYQSCKDEIFKIYYKIIKQNPNNLIMQSRDFNIFIVQTRDQENVKKMIKIITGEIEEKYAIKSKFGIGSSVDQIRDLKSSYLKSKIALDAIAESENQYFIFYDDMDIELILNCVSDGMAKEFIEKIFGDLSNKEMEEFEILFKSYEKNNGSIKKISEELFMHKNTIQYRLNMWSKRLGYDMRDFNNFTILKICSTLRKLKG